jgi:prolyl-tRNA synthetase
MAQDNNKTAITPTRADDYAQWYQEVIIAADLAENSPVRGCMVIKPWGYALWESIQQDLDRRFKATGHVNAYFPLLIPLSYLESEAKHVEGFAKECAVVTHSRLVPNEQGGLQPDGKLEEPYIIRPTSETIVGAMYAKWIKSYRDLPLLINQWANVMRWEMRTRMFLRTSEFLWQEGHTAHATQEEAMQETLTILDIYQQFIEQVLAIPVIKGEKPCFERFPGAVNTYTVEAMMQDCKALQAGTSHFLGQNFAQAAHIQFLDKDGSQKHAWTTSWGVSTRLIGGLIMTHSDDNGFIAPPRVAPKHIVILPIYRNLEDRDIVIDYCNNLVKQLSTIKYHGDDIRIHIDDRDLRGGEKTWQWIKKGVPLRIEVGMRDIQQGTLCVSRRDMEVKAKEFIQVEEFISSVVNLLNSIQDNLFNKAKCFMEERIIEVDTLAEFNNFFADELNQNKGFVSCYAVDDAVIEEFIKPFKVTARCIPLNQHNEPGKCIFTGRAVKQKLIFAKAY